jgi:N-acyl homoserine lactone hydrolase
MKLYLLRLGIMQAIQAPMPGYLIQTADGMNILIDTGYPRTGIGASQGLAQAPVKMDEQDYVVNQLASLGLTPHDIQYVICTHFDIDHAGNHDVFPEATFVVQRSHYEIARQGSLERLNQSRSSWDAPGLRYHLVDGDLEWLPGIELLETSGHVPGHQSVLVRLPQTGPVLLAIDALPLTKYLEIVPEQRQASPFDHDEVSLRASTRKLVDLVHQQRIPLVICGHDAAQWHHLKTLPDYYA